MAGMRAMFAGCRRADASSCGAVTPTGSPRRGLARPSRRSHAAMIVLPQPCRHNHAQYLKSVYIPSLLGHIFPCKLRESVFREPELKLCHQSRPVHHVQAGLMTKLKIGYCGGCKSDSGSGPEPDTLSTSRNTTGVLLKGEKRGCIRML